MSSASLIKTPPEKVTVNGWVFYTSTALILLLTAILIIAPQEAGRMLGMAQAWLSRSFGWYYMVVIAAYLVFVVGLAFSSYGKLKLGSKDDTPDFSYGAWAGMLFSSGIGISLLYFGASEPLDHYFNPPEGAAATNLAARQAVQLTFLHWGLHGWAIYALVGLAVAYFAYRHNQPLALRSALYPLVGERWVKGAAGHAVDGFGMFVTLLGLVTNLGIGSLQVSSGLENLFGMEHSNTNLLIVIIVMSTVATIAAVSGVENGIRRLSNLNIVLFSGLLIFVLLFGPTLHLLNGFVQNIGDYLNGVVLKTFDLYVYEGDSAKSDRWLGLWTLFYWAWWISWAPFVGMFIARISRGRTVRELVAGVLLIPLGFTLAWLSIFGNSALDLVMNQGAVELGKTALEQPSMAIYQLLEHYPASKVVIGVSIFVGFVLFLTPADSGAVMMANLSCKGGNVDEDAPHWLRIFWSVVITLVTIGLLFAGNFEAMQTMVVLAGLPFSVVLVFFMFGLHKAMRQDVQIEQEQAQLAERGRRGFSERLTQLDLQPSQSVVQRFMDKQVSPALENATAQMRAQGLEVQTLLGKSKRCMGVRVEMEEGNPFVYEVSLDGYLATPTESAQSDEARQRYYRAEVYLHNGSQDYDLMGFTQDQITRDVLDQFESHRQLLGRVYS
ncbi:MULTISPECIES: choline BCCT transporter BetT [Pseudomonas]|uniref:Bcct: transporter, betaine/carnitine/choline transporter n=2 Tax=Pseudomonas TaxID=286 RepID=A0AA94ERC7_9PSED|nr:MULTISPECIES: choline BCCT transporter BetT [Pseudomonas]MBT9264731.1 choline BCCT transporter BetT [Pseudomonas sp. MG-9]RVD79120.1 bcct: transporter, betaine/carnitine/choline transporter [Pseudomonas koreensis]WDR36998.1 choline BCCT transporter BetT [Pseudomonas serboccidentalis]